MAQATTIAMAVASQTPSTAIPIVRDVADMKSGGPAFEQRAHALLSPHDAIPPSMPAHAQHGSTPPAETLQEQVLEHGSGALEDDDDHTKSPRALPLSKGALSGLDASAAITPSMLAKHHLPGIMLGNGPRPIRYVMGELMRSVPGFSRIAPAKARRLVVAALESRTGGGVDGNVAFCKTGWGRWDAHIKGSSKDSLTGSSFPEGHLSPPRSEHSSFAFSQHDSAIQMPRAKISANYRDHRSGDSWTTSSHRIDEEEPDVDMDMPEHEADKMSLDGESEDPEDSSSLDDETDNEDWASVGVEALRKASLPAPGAPRHDYNALSVPYTTRWPNRSWSRRLSGVSARSHSSNLHSTSVPCRNQNLDPSGYSLDPAMQSPEERDAVAALVSMGSM